MHTSFFYLESFLKKLVDDQWSSIPKGSIYHIKHMYIQPFTKGRSGLTRNLMINGSIYYALCLQILCFYLVESNQYIGNTAVML